MSLSEQAVSFMAAAAAAYGPRALAPHAEAAPDTPEALGRSLLRMVPGDPVPLADFLASPADPARRAELEDWLYDALDEQPGLRAAMTTALTGYSRRRAAAGDARALADLGDLLSWQDEFEAARDAYQQAVDLGHDRALLSLASLVRECLGDADGARACLHRAIGSGDPDVAAEGMVDLGGQLCSAGDMTGGRAAFQDAIATGHPTWAPEAMMGLGHWLSMRGDRDGALAAYQQAIDSGRADLAGRAWFSVGKLLYRQGDLSQAESVLRRLVDSQDPDWSEPARFELINVLREQDDIDGLRAAAGEAAEAARPETPYAFVVIGEMLEDRGDAEGARTAYQQAIDADWVFADDLRDKLSSPAEGNGEDETLPADLPPRFHPDNITRTGLDVLDRGLPPLPEELSYQMAIPVAYWVASQCAVVLFLIFPRHGRRQRDPMIRRAIYSRTSAGWTRDPYSFGTFFGHDPIAEPGDLGDLGGQPMVGGGSMHFQEQPSPGYPAAVVTGRVAPAVTQIALIQDGHEDRRPLQSHFGAWVVCAERLGPFQVAGLASDGTTLATLDYSFPAS